MEIVIGWQGGGEEVLPFVETHAKTYGPASDESLRKIVQACEANAGRLVSWAIIRTRRRDCVALYENKAARRPTPESLADLLRESLPYLRAFYSESAPPGLSSLIMNVESAILFYPSK